MKNRLKELRKSKNLLQSEIAAQLNVAQSTYSYWENGTYDIDLASLKKLADFFGVSVDYLLDRSDTLPIIPPGLQDAQVAFSGDITKDLTEKEIAEMEKFRKFLLASREK